MVRKMIEAKFDNNKFTIKIGIQQVRKMWDDSYAEGGEYPTGGLKDILGTEFKFIDLNSFVAEQILSVLDRDGNEDESAGNEYFEDYDAKNCVVKSITDEEIVIVGNLVRF